MKTETVLKLYNTLILPTFLYGSENWTLTASQRRRIEAAEMKLLRPLAGYTLYDHKTNNSIRKELRITSTLDKKEMASTHKKNDTKNESLLNHTTTDRKEEDQLDDLKNVGESSCNPGDGTDQRFNP